MKKIDIALKAVALAIKGFMPEDEGDALYAAACLACDELPGLPMVEVGTYCGRSTVWLGAAAKNKKQFCLRLTTTQAVKKTNKVGSGSMNLWLMLKPVA